MTTDLTPYFATYGVLHLTYLFCCFLERRIERWQLRRIARGRREPVRTLSLVDAWRRERRGNNESRRWT